MQHNSRISINIFLCAFWRIALEKVDGNKAIYKKVFRMTLQPQAIYCFLGQRFDFSYKILECISIRKFLWIKRLLLSCGKPEYVHNGVRTSYIIVFWICPCWVVIGKSLTFKKNNIFLLSKAMDSLRSKMLARLQSLKYVTVANSHVISFLSYWFYNSFLCRVVHCYKTVTFAMKNQPCKYKNDHSLMNVNITYVDIGVYIQLCCPNARSCRE